MSETIQRYDLGEEFTDSPFRDYNVAIVPQKDGEYVTYGDHRAAVEKLEALLREWRSLFVFAPPVMFENGIVNLCKRTEELLKED